MKTFDLIVLGTGAAASGVARDCRAAGMSVAIVDARPYGGTCALRGCDPKKVLVGAAEALGFARRMAVAGVRTPGATLDWPTLHRFKQTFVDSTSEHMEAGFREAGIVTLHGRARFTGPHTVRVGDEELEGRQIHLAVGAVPRRLGIVGEELLMTSDGFLDLEELPKRIVFLGGGYIAFEFAHLSAVAGAEVTVLDRNERPLTLFDPDLVDLLVEHTRAVGIRLEAKNQVLGVERSEKGFVVRASGPGGEQRYEADLVVHAAGRVPDLDDLDLAAGNIERVARGVSVNEFLQSVSNPAVYSAGDCAASGPPLTPVAGFESRVVTANLLKAGSRKVEYPPVPGVVFTMPPLASVGLGEAEAKRRGLSISTHFARTEGWYSSRRVNEGVTGYKIVLEQGSGKILGAHLFGWHAEEVMNVFALAVRQGLTADYLKQSIWTYPTATSDIAYML